MMVSIFNKTEGLTISKYNFATEVLLINYNDDERKSPNHMVLNSVKNFETMCHT